MDSSYWQQTDRVSTLLELRKYKEAKRAADKLAEHFPEDKHVLYLFGLSRVLSGEIGAAKAVGLHLQELYPASSEADAICFYVAEAEGDAKTMISFACRQVAQYPEDSMWHLNLGNAYLANGQVEQAEAFIISALGISPRDPDVLVAFASCKHYKGDLFRAKELIREALAIDPEHRSAMLLNSVVSLGLGEKNDQLEHELLQVLSSNPTDEIAEESRLQLLNLYINRSAIISFFAGSGFAKYKIEWTLGRIVLMVIFWKGVILWGVFGMLYLIANWYGAVLFNSVALFHRKWKYLQNQDLRREAYIGVASLILIGSIILGGKLIGYHDAKIAYCISGLLMATLFVASYFRVPNLEKAMKVRSIGIPILSIVLFIPYFFYFPQIDDHYFALLIPFFLMLVYGFAYTLNLIGKKGIIYT